ncbi:type II toxin-antitoxin system YhaV family toxin [Bradyrhizobium sp.]|uniref:type II toxin-antitoxin system YhaV family toxin n=1 Tax=Bradyrhizobium sp. TaxID=376 RepID=UPI003C6F4E29
MLLDRPSCGILEAGQHEICDRPPLQGCGMFDERLLLRRYPGLKALCASAAARGFQNRLCHVISLLAGMYGQSPASSNAADRFLFFRYNSKAAVIIYAWVNDENTLRKAGSGNDPYHLFGGMLRKGRPPDDWIALTKEAAAYVPPKLEGKPPLPERGAARAITKDEL